MGKKIKADVCVNGNNYKSVYVVIEKLTDIHGNVIREIKQNDFLELGCNLVAIQEGGAVEGLKLMACKYKTPCVDLKVEPMGKAVKGKQVKTKSKTKTSKGAVNKKKKVTSKKTVKSKQAKEPEQTSIV